MKKDLLNFIQATKHIILTVFLLAFILFDAMSQIEMKWTPNCTTYGGLRMSITGVVVLDGAEMRSDMLEVGAFYGDECRGSLLTQYVDPFDKYICFLTICGDDPVTLTFKVYDHGTGAEYLADNTEIYTTGASLGFPDFYEFMIHTPPPFVPVTDITGVPASADVGTPLILTGTVVPNNANNQTIVWSVKNAGTTGASISGSTFNATGAGTATITATIADGLAVGTPYIKDFEILVILPCPPSVVDKEGNVYPVVPLAGMCWMATNLRNRTYNDDDATPIAFAKPYYHNSNPDSAQYKIDYGLLYDYASAFPEQNSADILNICPDGWRIPTIAEWALLNMYSVEDLKHPVFWLQPNSYTNATNLNIRGAGYFNNGSQRFEDLNGYTAFWSSDPIEPNAATSLGACIRYFCSQIEMVEIKLGDGVSVRCVMND
jgi:uncharacterized protein (TIGR02145 family)